MWFILVESISVYYSGGQRVYAKQAIGYRLFSAILFLAAVGPQIDGLRARGCRHQKRYDDVVVLGELEHEDGAGQRGPKDS